MLIEYPLAQTFQHVHLMLPPHLLFQANAWLTSSLPPNKPITKGRPLQHAWLILINKGRPHQYAWPANPTLQHAHLMLPPNLLFQANAWLTSSLPPNKANQQTTVLINMHGCSQSSKAACMADLSITNKSHHAWPANLD